MLPGYFSSTVAQDRNKCELRAEINVESSLPSPQKNKVTVKLEDGIAPIKYIFYEEFSGRLLQKDFSKNSVDDLEKGSYYCLIIDDNGCTKKIQFQIQ
jgi:hypothetical protein